MIALYIAVGGAAGAVARYALGGWIHEWAGSRFPWETFAINILGSLLIGFALRTLEALPASPELRTLVTSGCSAVSPRSARTRTKRSSCDGEWLWAALYSVGSLLIGLAAVGVGLTAAAVVLEPGS